MMDMFTLWALFVALPGISVISSVTFLVMLLAGVFALVLSPMWYDEIDDTRRVFKWIARYVITLCMAAVISVITPTQKEMMLLVGGYAATNIEGIEKLPPNLVNAANAYLESVAKASKESAE